MSVPDPSPRRVAAMTAGWYADPDDPLGHRYWDGARWLTQCERLVEQGHEGVCPGDAESP